MDHHVKRGIYAAPFLIAAFALGPAACSQGASSSRDGDGTFDNTSGALVAHLRRIPDDVRCIDIQTSDWHRSQVQTDVQPGGEATIQIAPLTPGYVYFWGTAYSVPCWQIYYGDGGPWGNQTWTADSANAYVQSGSATPVSMTFRRLGSVDVSVDFADGPICDGGAGSEPDGGPPCPLPPRSPDGG